MLFPLWGQYACGATPIERTLNTVRKLRSAQAFSRRIPSQPTQHRSAFSHAHRRPISMISAAGLPPFPGSLGQKAHATFSSSVSCIINWISHLGKTFFKNYPRPTRRPSEAILYGTPSMVKIEAGVSRVKSLRPPPKRLRNQSPRLPVLPCTLATCTLCGPSSKMPLSSSSAWMGMTR